MKLFMTALFACAIAIGACSSSSSGPTTLDAGGGADSGRDAQPPADAGGCNAQVDPGNQACTSCVTQRCQTQLTACAASCDCITVANCVFACDTGSAADSERCARTCLGASDAGADLAQPFTDCVSQNCLAADDAGAISGQCAR